MDMVAKQLQHFSHRHLLSLVHLQPNNINEEEEEDEDEDLGDDFVVEDHHYGECKMCKEQIYSFHLCYYNCNDCNYKLHKFCAEMPSLLHNHPLHPNHKITLAEGFQDSDPDYGSDYEWTCGICNLKRKNLFNYNCSICEFNMDIICATISQQKMDHPSHPHQLQRGFQRLVSRCNACSHEHEGTFYHCTTCSCFSVHLDCALLPSKLLIQQSTNETFTHSHPLTLAYSFPLTEIRARFYPRCRVCGGKFFTYFWIYKCDKCRYYVHTECATSKTEPFMSILLSPGLGKLCKNFKDDDHPNLLHCPFPYESSNLVKHHFSINKDLLVKENNDSIHQHLLILLDTQTSLLHNPMKKIQLLCDGCVRPITTMPFYKCSEDVRHCSFVLHEWCARLPPELQDHPGHPEHQLVLLPNIPRRFFGVFVCAICKLPSNSFAYGCTTCGFYVDVNCAFLPKEITHEAHPNHLLSTINVSSNMSNKYCNSCHAYVRKSCIAFHCSSCDFYLDTECAFFLPKMIRHKYDKHPLNLRYNPAENHPSNYFCEICEDEFDPKRWFYHCSICAQSMHPSCANLILGCEQNLYSKYMRFVFQFINVKFGRTLKIDTHPHLLSFVQGIKCHGKCKECDEELQYEVIFKCLVCEYALHYKCCASLIGN